MNKEIQEAIQYIDSVVWCLEPENRRHLLSLTTFAKEWGLWKGPLSEALGAQILLEANELRESYEFAEETETRTRRVLRAKV